MRWVLRFGYDGHDFDGWARQPGRRTVEGVLLAELQRRGLARPASAAHLEVASRTDGQVSARANALAVDLPLDGAAVLRAMNGLAPPIFFTAAAPAPPGFRVRSALDREYRYYLPGTRARAGRLDAIARSLPSSIDVRSFGRGIRSPIPVLRPLGSVRARYDGTGVRVDVRARSFVWGMVRKIVAGLLEVEAGRWTVGDLIAAADGAQPRPLPLAPPDALLLWEVRLPIRWTVRAGPAPARQAAHWAEIRRHAETRLRLFPRPPLPGRSGSPSSRAAARGGRGPS